MYDDFKPLQPIDVFVKTPIEENTSIQEEPPEESMEKDHLLEEIEALKNHLRDLESAYKSLLEEKEKLLKERELLNSEIEELKSQNEKLKSLFVSIKESISQSFERIRLNAVSELSDVLERALEIITDSSYFPHEEVMIKAFSKAFERIVDMKGDLTIRVNPVDFELVKRLVQPLADEMKDTLRIQVSEDKSLKRDEFVVETPKLWIERKREEFIRDALEMAIGDVQGIQ